MSKPELTKDIAYDSLQRFFHQKPLVLFATGTSCAVDTEFGMAALEAHLKKEFEKESLSSPQRQEWKEVLKSLETNNDFEASMNKISDSELISLVIQKTAEKVSEVDRNYRESILDGSKKWPAIYLLKKMVNALPETDRILHIATPNYDLLAEYAFIYENIPYTTGFCGGVVRKLDWKQANRQMTYLEETVVRNKKLKIARFKKHIRLYKVHGAINMFCHKNQFVETDVWTKTAPDKIKRVMVTPGEAKYQTLADFRSELLAEYDNAIHNHSNFLFLGFGFNDQQLIANSLADKIKNQECPVLIITRDINNRIEKILHESKNAWIVCKTEKCGDESARIFNREYKNWLKLPGNQLWHFDKFSSEILGD